MLASLMSKNGLKSQIESKLTMGLKVFLEEGNFAPKQTSSAPSFFITSDVKVDSTQLNLYLLNTLKEFNRHAANKLTSLKEPSHRNFFL